MGSVLVLGAGRMAGPLVCYLLEQSGVQVKVASLLASDAEKVVGGHARGQAEALDVTDTRALRAVVSDTAVDVVVGFVPPACLADVAKTCIEAEKPLVTAAYADDELKALDEAAKTKGILILTEMGLDPGIDHMSAIRSIHKIQREGGKVVSFYSVCGAIPAMESSLNPFGYKFAWEPRGALNAAKRSARYLMEGQEVDVPTGRLFEHYTLKHVEGLGYFENYPNKDSLPYMEIFGIPTARTMYRGTLRYIGWGETLKKLIEIGMLDEKERNDLGQLSYRELLCELTGLSDDENLKENLAGHLRIDKDSAVMKRLEWFDLLSNSPLPLEEGSPFDVLLEKMLEKLGYEDGERDMIILQDEIVAEYPKRKQKERFTETLIAYGTPGGDTALAKTVGVPAGIATKLILQGRINLTGVHIPVAPAIYEPVLEELEKEGIVFAEKVVKLET